MELLFLCYESCLTSCLDTSNILTQYSGVWNISHQHREISRSSLLCNAKCPENYRPCYAARFLVVDLFRMFVPYGWYLNVCDIRWCWFTKKRSCTKNIWICGPPKVWQVQETGKWWPIMINQSNWGFFLLLHLLSEGASNSKHLQNTSWYVSGFLMLSSYGALQVVCSSKLPLLEKPFLEVTKAHPRYWQPKAPANWPAKCSWSNAARHFFASLCFASLWCNRGKNLNSMEV